jgi:hypothetical protein
MKAIVHIGTEKTGTQSIQACLHKNRRALADAGYVISQSDDHHNSRALAAYGLNPDKKDDYLRSNNIRTPEERECFQHSFEQRFRDEIQSLPAETHTVIFSSEHFHSRLKTQQEVERVRDLLAPHFDEFKIICYLRDQASCCASSYSTEIKSGRVISLATYSSRCVPENHYYNYSVFLSLWEDVFGLHALDVALFDPSCLLNRNLLDDFTARLGPELVGRLNTDLPAENESLSRTGLVLSKMISRLAPKETQRKIWQKGISGKLTGPGERLSLELRQNIFNAFRESNEAVRKKFFPDRAVLFPPPRQPSEEKAM